MKAQFTHDGRIGIFYLLDRLSRTMMSQVILLKRERHWDFFMSKGVKVYEKEACGNWKWDGGSQGC